MWLKIYYRLTDAPKRKRYGATAPVLVIGKAIHKIVQNRFRDNPLFTVRKEIPIDDTVFALKNFLVGNCDMGFYIDSNPILGVEIKSGTIYSSPQEAHMIQATVYQHSLQFPFMWYFYANRDGDRWRSFITTKPSPAAIECIEEDCQRVLNMAMNRTPPEPTTHFLKCQSCDYLHLCKKNKVC